MVALFWVELDAVDVVVLHRRPKLSAITSDGKHILFSATLDKKGMQEIESSIRREVRE